jgi:hypothetical protein
MGIAYIYKLEGLCFAKFHTGRVTITELALDQFFFYKIIGDRSKWAGLQAEFAADAEGWIQLYHSQSRISGQSFYRADTNTGCIIALLAQGGYLKSLIPFPTNDFDPSPGRITSAGICD